MKTLRPLIIVALMLGSVAHAQSKKELAQKVLQLQQPAIENLARQMTTQPADQLLQQAGMALGRVPADKREATGKAIQAEAQKYVDAATPIIRDKAIALAPSTIGPVLEEKFTDDELKQLVAWLESPTSKKYGQLMPDMTNALVRKLSEEGAPLVNSKIEAMQKASTKLLDDAIGQKASAPAAGKKSK